MDDAIVASPAPFAAVFGVLRARLERQIIAPDAAAAEAARVNALAPHDGSHGAVTGRPSAVLARLGLPSDAFVTPRAHCTSESYRERRRHLRLRRERLQQRGRAVRRALDATLGERLQRLDVNNDAFQNGVEVAHTNALRRLQALGVECITEIHKAVERAHSAFATRVTVDEEDLRRQSSALRAALQWRIFLARLEEDTQQQLRSDLLLPSTIELLWTETSPLVAELARLIATNGPVLAQQVGVVIDTIVAIAESRENVAGSHKADESRVGGTRKPSLHFVDSMEAAWTDITGSFRPTTASSSTIKPRRFTPPVPANAAVLFSTTITSGNNCSPLRRVVAAVDARVSGFAVDTALTCSGIKWLFIRQCVPSTQEEDNEISSPWRLRDANVYIDVRGYIEQSRAQSSASEDMDATMAEHVRKREKQLTKLVTTTDDEPTAFAARGVVQDNEGSPFVRATLLELIQTSYARDQFLPLVNKDIEDARDVYPSWLLQLRTIPALYVAMETSHDGPVRMVALDAVCLHELCVLYVARGVCTKKSPRRTVASLVQADAFSVLPPAKTENSKYCLVRSSPLLLRAAGGLLSQDWVGMRPMVFVEYHLESISADAVENGGNTTVGTSTSKKREVLRLLGPVCAWRSCLDTVTQATPGHGVMLCDWHKSIQSSVNESAHFLPNLKDLKACLKAPDEQQRDVETVKKVLVKSSSLLEELTSRHLGQSIVAFLTHAKRALSNTSFEERLGHRSGHGGVSLASTSEDEDEGRDAVASRRTHLDTMQQVFAVEQAVTAALRVAMENGISPLPLAVQSEWSELDNDIRTDNYALILELSRRKLALLQSRLHETEGDAAGAGRLAHSLSDGVLGRRSVERETLAQMFPRPHQGDVRARARQEAKAARPKSATQKR